MKFCRVAPGVEDLTGSATLSSILRCFRWKKWGSSLVQVSAQSLHHVTGIKCQKNLIRHRRPKEAKTQNEHRRYSNSQSRYSDYYLELFICFLHVSALESSSLATGWPAGTTTAARWFSWFAEMCCGILTQRVAAMVVVVICKNLYKYRRFGRPRHGRERRTECPNRSRYGVPGTETGTETLLCESVHNTEIIDCFLLKYRFFFWIDSPRFACDIFPRPSSSREGILWQFRSVNFMFFLFRKNI